MYLNLFQIILFGISLSSVSSVKYYYITNDETIHTTDSDLHELWSNGLNRSTVAVMSYENNVNKTGWANLELKSFDHFSDDIQSYMSGLLEGYITGELIQMYFETSYDDFCTQKTQFCELLKDFVKNNTKFIEKMIEENKDNEYWHQIHLIYEQIRGLEAGYKKWKVDNNRNSKLENEDISELFLFQLQFETGGLQNILTPESPIEPEDHCSAFVKPMADGSDLFVAHNTWGTYSHMLRVLKKYSFAFNSLKSNNTKRIPGHSVAFSSRPGIIHSGDDFYVLSSELAVQETTLSVPNYSLYRNIRPDNVVFEFARNVVANRLADSGKEWTELFGAYNSGTYNNQFMIVDYKVFKRGTKVSQLSDGLLWIIEQIPHHNRAEDVTHIMRQQGYWASYNRPYFEDIFKLSGNEEKLKEFGSYFSHNMTARAQIFRRDHSKVTDLKTLFSLMRYNDFKNDPLSQCSQYSLSCSPPYSAYLAISSRGDLNDPNGKYPLTELAYRANGAIDAKATHLSMIKNLEMLAVNGPTDAQNPPFQWSKSDLKVKHIGQPDVFNFKPISVKWFS